MLIVIAHGSRNARWRESVERVVESIDLDLGRDRVRVAYMDCSPPTLMDVVSDAVRTGTTSFQVLPLFLAVQGHVERDIVPIVEDVRNAWPSVAVELLEPLGQQPEFKVALGRIARRSGVAENERNGQTS